LKKIVEISWIDWCLMPNLAVFQLHVYIVYIVYIVVWKYFRSNVVNKSYQYRIILCFYLFIQSNASIYLQTIIL